MIRFKPGGVFARRINWPVTVINTTPYSVLTTDGILDCRVNSTVLTLPLSTDVPGRYFIVAGRPSKTINTQGGELIYSRIQINGTTSWGPTSAGSVQRLWNNGSGAWFLMDPAV